MSNCLSILIRNDFYGIEDTKKAVIYAKAAFPLFKKLYNDPRTTFNVDEDDSMNNGITDVWIYPYVYDETNEICGILLRDGFWAIETLYDDYLLTRNTEQGSYEVLNLCEDLCKALKQSEAWICVDGHLTNSFTAPNNYNDWLKYAQQFGIVELTCEIINQLDSNREWFVESRYIIDGKDVYLSSPIYHISY